MPTSGRAPTNSTECASETCYGTATGLINHNWQRESECPPQNGGGMVLRTSRPVMGFTSYPELNSNGKRVGEPVAHPEEFNIWNHLPSNPWMNLFKYSNGLNTAMENTTGVAGGTRRVTRSRAKIMGLNLPDAMACPDPPSIKRNVNTGYTPVAVTQDVMVVIECGAG
ncbi:hypothetical protein K440DRAFT_679515 [Wilcoxina mikolae CBS 423.85]|nr:hypothetical protein K440DRAFT_679515 [Wilcoxina mikolae CBS 423.85]